jgi:hypothetical protein
MKKFYALVLILLFVGTGAMAQISIDEVKAEEKAEFRDSIKTTSADTEYFNEARYRAERAAIRKERNFLEVGAAVQGTLSAYNNAWIATSGGDNAVAVMATARLHHIYTKGTFTIESKVDAKFGYNRMNVEYEDGTDQGIWFKNQDEFSISTAPAYKFSKHWNFGAILKFRSQFANGYVSRTEQESIHRKSRFMSPGYFDVSVGFTYNCPWKYLPVKVNLSPIAMNSTFVKSQTVRDYFFVQQKAATAYGIEDPNNTSLWEGGSSIQIDFDQTWGKNGWLRYRTTLYSFFGWITSIDQTNKYRDFGEYQDALQRWSNPEDLSIGHTMGDKPHLAIHPTVRWENSIEIKATKYIATQINFQLYYNRAQCYDVQLQTLLSVGFSYTFKNK